MGVLILEVLHHEDNVVAVLGPSHRQLFLTAFGNTAVAVQLVHDSFGLHLVVLMGYGQLFDCDLSHLTHFLGSQALLLNGRHLILDSVVCVVEQIIYLIILGLQVDVV